MNANAESRAEVRHVRDLYGRHYRIGETAEQLTGHSRRTLLWSAWVCMVAISPLQYGFGVAVPGLQDANGWGHTQTMWLLAAFVVCQAGTAVPVAWMHRRSVATVRQLVVGGGLLSAIGLLCLAFVQTFAGALLGYSVIGGVGAGMVYATCLATSSKWFPEKRVAMSGFVTGGFACGAVPAIVLITWVGEGGPAIVLALAGVVAAVVVTLVGRMLQDPPRYWWPAHIDAQVWAVDRQMNRSLPHNLPAVRHYTPGDAMRTGVLPRIWLLLASISAVSLLGIAMVVSFAVTAGVGLTAAGLAAAVLAAVNGVARATAGRLSDRFGRRQVLAAVLALEGVAQFGLVWAGHAESVWVFIASATFAGLGGGAFYAIFANVVLEYFGDRSLLQNQAIVYSAKAVGGLAGIGVAAACAARFGYTEVFVAAGLLGLASAAFVGLLHQPGRPALPVRPQPGIPAVPGHVPYGLSGDLSGGLAEDLSGDPSGGASHRAGRR